MAATSTESLLLSVDGVSVDLKPPQHPPIGGTCRVELHATQLEIVSAANHRLNLPFTAIKCIDLHQPIFGANYIVGEYCREGRTCTFTLTFAKGGATDFTRVFFRVSEGHLVQDYNTGRQEERGGPAETTEATQSSREDKKNR